MYSPNIDESLGGSGGTGGGAGGYAAATITPAAASSRQHGTPLLNATSAGITVNRSAGYNIGPRGCRLMLHRITPARRGVNSVFLLSSDADADAQGDSVGVGGHGGGGGDLLYGWAGATSVEVFVFLGPLV